MLCTIELKQLHSFLLHPVAKLLVHDIKKLTHFPSYTHKNVHTIHTHAHTIDLHTHTYTLLLQVLYKFEHYITVVCSAKEPL